MGLLTLGQFKTELNSHFGDRGLDNERLTLWINLAYFELCGMQQFEDLKCHKFFDTVADTYIYEVPEKFLSFVSVWDATNKLRLKRQDTQDVGLVDPENTGQPEKWTIRANALWLTPVPDDVYRIQAVYVKEPTVLSADSDVTVIPSSWDFSILLLAKQFGHLAFREAQDANAAMARAVTNIGSNLTDEQRLAKTPMGGLSVAWDESDLTDQQ